MSKLHKLLGLVKVYSYLSNTKTYYYIFVGWIPVGLMLLDLVNLGVVN